MPAQMTKPAYTFFNMKNIIDDAKEQPPCINYYGRMRRFSLGQEAQADSKMIAYLDKQVTAKYQAFKAELAEAKRRAKEREKLEAKLKPKAKAKA